MKCHVLIAIFALNAIGMSNTFAMCAVNDDWPDAPCMDMIVNGHYPQEQVDRWVGYYDFKGDEFMEAKKQEMNQAVQDDNLQEWIDESIQNYNVWTYYYFSGEAPSIPNYHDAAFEMITRDRMPLQNIISIHNPFWHDPQSWIIAVMIGSILVTSTLIVWKRRII